MTAIFGTLEQTNAGTALVAFLVSLAPVVELRGGIVIGITNGLNPWLTYIICVAGNMLPIPFIILFARKIFAWMRRRSSFLKNIAEKLENRAVGKWGAIHRFQFFALMIFVAIPLPGTGAWTGALIAAVANMRLKQAMPSIFIGVLIAGFLMTGFSIGLIKLFW